MPPLRRLSVLVLALTLGACRDGSRADSPPGSPGSDTVTGAERLGWLQPLEGSDPARLRYALYVDGGRRVLEGETCQPGPAAAECSAPLPPLGPGRHTLEVAAFINEGGEILESPRSAPLVVTVAASTSLRPSAAPGGPLVGSGGERLHADVLARDLEDPVDLAVAAGRILLAHGNGVVRVLQAAAGAVHPSQEQDNVIALFPDAAGEEPLLSIAAAADHSSTGHVHLLYKSFRSGEAAVHLGRVRIAGGRFGEAAVLASFPAGRDAVAVLRLGPDGMQYVGLGSLQAVDAAMSASAPSGTILRLDREGRTPADQPSASPMLTTGHRDPRGLAWLNGSMWEVEGGDSAAELNRIRASADYGWPSHDLLTETRAGVSAPALLLAGAGFSGVAAPHPSSPFAGDLIVSARAAEDLFRIRVAADGPARVVSRLLQGRFGPVVELAAGDDGALYFITAGADGTGGALVRLTAAAAALPRGSAQ